MNRGRTPWTVLAATTLLSCGGCADFLPQRNAPAEGELPGSFSQSLAEATANDRWWQDFESPELDALVDEALAGNLTLRQAWARLAQSGSTAVQAASALYPELSFEADAGYTRSVTTTEGTSGASFGSQVRTTVVNGLASGISNALSGNSGETGTGGASAGGSLSGGATAGGESSSQRVTAETRQFGLSLAASYELDVWGRIASTYRAARFDVDASREDLESTAMTLVAEVVQRWLGILEQQALHEVLTAQVETNRTYLELVELRFRKSLASALDVYQQRQAVSEVESQFPLVEAQEQLLRHELALLLGRAPASELAAGGYDLERLPPPPDTGLPADLLVNRPDVRAALARLEAADRRVAAARADRLPAIRLSGGIGYNAADITSIFDDWFLNLAAGLTAPLFDGFRRQAEVERTLAVVEERLANYRLTVLTAIKDVEDALVRERRQREYIDALTRQQENTRNELREATERYRKGQNDYLPVLTALGRTQALTRTLVGARTDLLVYRLNLYRALGGSWTQELSAPPAFEEQNTVAKVTHP